MAESLTTTVPEGTALNRFRVKVTDANGVGLANRKVFALVMTDKHGREAPLGIRFVDTRSGADLKEFVNAIATTNALGIAVFDSLAFTTYGPAGKKSLSSLKKNTNKNNQRHIVFLFLLLLAHALSFFLSISYSSLSPLQMPTFTAFCSLSLVF